MKDYKIPLISAHRGLSPEYPENTILAFQKAIEVGVDLFELDVRISKDKELIVCHDADLFRCSGKHGLVQEMDYSEIKNFDLGMNQSVPLLLDVFKLIRNTNIKLMIEIKAFEIEELLLEFVEKQNMKDSVMFGSMLFPIMMQLRELDGNISLYPSVGKLTKFNTQDLINQVNMVNGQYLNIDFTCITKDLVDICHKNDIGIHAGTPDELVDMVRMMKYGADIIVTNEPRKILDYMKSKGISNN